jgi:16S rRNA (uracil1498-N3)-methyltransferase
MVERTHGASVATFFSPEGFADTGHLTLGDDAAQHARVIRLEPGDEAELRDGVGGAAIGTVTRLAKRSITIDVQKRWSIPRPPAVHMMVPVADRDRMLLLAEKATELGVTSWRPVIWRRSKSVAARGEGPTFVARLKGRMISALTQSGGGWLPEIHPGAPIQRAVTAAPDGTRLLLDPAASTSLLSAKVSSSITIALGPEGGFENEEREEMIAAAFMPVRIAGNILRFETAGIAALAGARMLLDLAGHGTGSEQGAE